MRPAGRGRTTVRVGLGHGRVLMSYRQTPLTTRVEGHSGQAARGRSEAETGSDLQRCRQSQQVHDSYYPEQPRRRTILVMSYADYCPIASGVEILGDRWTPLVIRELTVGATGFNEIHRGIPKMSRTLLAQRLRTLERQGLVIRETAGRGHAGAYHLTPAGQALSQVVWSIGQWAAEWTFADPADEDVDALSLLWRMHQFAITSALPRERTCVHLILTGERGAEAWLKVDRREMTVCKDDPGLDVDVAVEVSVTDMYRWLVGRVSFSQLVREGDARLLGPSRLARAFPKWFDTETFTTSARRGERRRARLAVANAG